MSTRTAGMARISEHLQTLEKRLKRGWQRRLATLAGVSAEAITHWKKGDGNPSLSELEGLAEALGVSVASLISTDPELREESTLPARLEDERERERQLVLAEELSASLRKSAPGAKKKAGE